MGAINYNSDLSNEFRDAGKIQQTRDRIPQEFGDKILPVCEVNPKLLKNSRIIFSGSTSSTATSTILYTVPTGKILYITGVNIQNYSDAAADNTSIFMFVYQDGAAVDIIRMRKPTLTLFQDRSTMSYFFPIKIDKESTIRFTNTFTVGASSTSYAIFGFFDDIAGA